MGRLVEDGWTACGPTEAWDVEKEGTRLLLATERGDCGAKNTLVRLSGEMTKVPVWLRNVSMMDSARDAG